MICDDCGKPLCKADILVGAETCSDCDRRKIMAAVAKAQAARISAAGVSDNWPAFLAVLRQAVRPDGTVHQSDVRPLVRDRFAPKVIASLYRRARADRVLVEIGTERSNDVAGRNAGRHEPYYRLCLAA